jgi:hypothetical protein
MAKLMLFLQGIVTPSSQSTPPAFLSLLSLLMPFWALSFREKTAEDVLSFLRKHIEAIPLKI